MYIASFDLCCYRRTFLFQVHVVEILQSAMLSYSDFHFADHSIGLSKIECVAQMKLFILVFGVLNPRGGRHKSILRKRV